MFRNLTSQLAAAATGTNAQGTKVMSPSLRSDIYSAMDTAQNWVVGGRGAGQAGDGVSYGTMLSTIQMHFPNIKVGLESIGHAEAEVAAIVGGITNMIMEYSRWESMSGGMAMRTWVDGLVDVYQRMQPGTRKDEVAKGITRGTNQNSDVALMTKDFGARIQMISCLKTGRFLIIVLNGDLGLIYLLLVSSRIYGQGSVEARQAEAILSSRFM